MLVQALSSSSLGRSEAFSKSLGCGEFETMEQQPSSTSTANVVEEQQATASQPHPNKIASRRLIPRRINRVPPLSSSQPMPSSSRTPVLWMGKLKNNNNPLSRDAPPRSKRSPVAGPSHISMSQPNPLTRTDTLVEFPSPPPSPPRLPPPHIQRPYIIEPRGNWVCIERAPESRDYAYSDLKPVRPILPPTRTLVLIDPSQPESSQEQSEPSSSQEDSSQDKGLIRQDAFIVHDRSSPWPSEEVTESQAYKASYVATPIVSPNGSYRFDSNSQETNGLEGRRLDFGEALEKVAHEQKHEAGDLAPAFEMNEYPVFDSGSPLSSVPSPLSDTLGTSMEEEVDSLLHHHLSAPTREMSSLSLIGAEVPELVTRSPHRYSLRSSSNNPTPQPSPNGSPRRNLPRRARSNARAASPPVRRNQQQVNSVAAYGNDEIWSAPTPFERAGGRRIGKRTREEGSQSNVDAQGPSRPRNETDEISQPVTRSMTRKNRKIE